MCGIAGIYGLEGLPDPVSIAQRMTSALTHRGPDATGTQLCGNAVLGHVRLSIIDLSPGADQPFRSADGRYTLVYNGELYNFRELRSELESGASPWAFRTGSDTEVLLAAYQRWGADCLPRLQGMFAFAVHDALTGDLFLARDRMGIKPLYLYQNDRHILFASEVRALLASELVPRRLDTENLVDHLRYQTVHAPDTLLRGVRMLPAGYCIRISDQEVQERRWYDLVGSVDPSAVTHDREEVKKEVRQRLARAVEKRLVSDVPFGAFLSGGIDSSAVVALMAEASSSPVHTFSVVFDEADYSEEQYADLVARRFRTEHTPIRLRVAVMPSLLPDALAAMDHPSADGVNTYVVSKAVKEAGITMVLSGLGGDELFAGYPVFKRSLALWERRWVTQFPLVTRQLVASLARSIKPSIAGNKLAELLTLRSFSVDDTYPVSRLSMTDRELVGLLRQEELPSNRVAGILRDLIRKEGGYALPFLSQVSIGELSTYLQNVLLRDTDQMSMAHALEVRVPFLDHDLVEYVLGVSDTVKFPHSPKQLLVEAMGPWMAEVAGRPKMGFTLPWELWMRGELNNFCSERLHRLSQRDLFKPGSVDRMWHRFQAKDPRVNWARLWSLVVLEDWMERNRIDHI